MTEGEAPEALIVRAAGTNCDRELAHAFALAGARPVVAHVNELIAAPERVERSSLIGLPGGFSYGDDVAAGRILAHRLRRRLLDPIRGALARGAWLIGVCNGFQVLAKMGLLPDPDSLEATTTLGANESGRFQDEWVPLAAEPGTACGWLAGLDRFELPIAHGEGRFVAASADTLEALARRGQIALRYAEGHNPNGSAGRVAGICDPSGRVLGLMPHPERAVTDAQAPGWPRGEGPPVGLALFRNAVVGAAGRAAELA